jgi:DNA-binding NtrC family response regulator
MYRDITERRTAETSPQVRSRGYRSKPMQAALSAISRAASSDVIVLLQGESGSGKDYAARRIHDLSNRAGGPFFSINCAALPHALAESELFGHEAGAFTGAAKRKKGLLELAEGGTLLLNEIGELSLSLQSKLLSFLDTKTFLRVGGEKSITINARLMAATHRDLEVEGNEGRFLRPLYYRLSVFSIHIPALRERVEDIPSIAEELMVSLARELQYSEIPVIEPADMKALQGYHWPGNIRELRNVLERSLIVSGGGPFQVSLPTLEQASRDRSHPVPPLSGRTLRDVTHEVTQELCMEALRVCEGSKTAAARMLGISRGSMYRHLKRFGLA